MRENGSLLNELSVTPAGTIYYIRGEATCGGAVLVKTTLDRTTFVLADLGAGEDVLGTRVPHITPPAHTVRHSNGTRGTRLHSDTHACTNRRFVIDCVGDVEPVPPPGPADP